MSRAAPRRVAVVGLGVIGGSVALALRDRAVDVVGAARSREDREAARRAGIEVAESVAGAVARADVVVLAVPIDALVSVAREAGAGAPGALLLHTGSVQRAARLGLDALDVDVLGTHPIAGTHASGFNAARAELFVGAELSVEARATAAQRAVIEWLWTGVGARRIAYRDAETHDRRLAWASHLPQLAATALASALQAAGCRAADLGPGGAAMTRLAMSDREMWRGILAANADHVAAAVAALERELAALRASLAASDGDAAEADARWEEARRWRMAAIAEGR